MFNEIFSNKNRNDGILLGSPEAEAEANPNSKTPLLDVYGDFHDLGGKLATQNFIVIARKGCGKSAFGKYVVTKATNEPNLFASFVRGSDYQFEKLVQLGRHHNDNLATEALFTWLVLTNMLRLIVDNQLAHDNKKFKLLQDFLRRNSGYIDIDQYQIDQLVQQHGWTVNIEPLRKFLRVRSADSLEIRSGRAPFYALIPHLEKVIVGILSDKVEIDNNNSYLLFFDDLDIGFKSDNEQSCDSIMSLIRVCRKLNNELFANNNINAKVIVFLRDDIEAYLTNRYADTARVFSSYGVKVSWFQDLYTGNDQEDQLFMKQFINKRIKFAFERAQKTYNKQDPWASLVKENIAERSSFKYVLNNTLFRPRDLLLFFKPLESGAFRLPLGKDQIRSLSELYSEELAREVKNELSSFYDEHQINMIFSAIGSIDASSDVTYTEAENIVHDNCTNVDPGNLLRHLFDRSIIGNIADNGWVTFKCRQPINPTNLASLDESQKIIVQTGVATYVRRHSYAR